ncbi:hypothetical protein [Halospina sp. K52047b]|uniref:hypothetical protein n=1 Tax=Halospina sp. K52047b TaxID=2614160 RepID=UPI00124A7106|nr:hypothetical protein [Halospina sp. K52047b]KAA8984553.1 hypothetical protein F3089_04185 [Halospina sp. K52047b]
MTDITKWGKWGDLLWKYRQERRIEKSEVLDALENDPDMPPEAAPMVKSIVAGDYKFPRGKKPDWDSLTADVWMEAFTGIVYEWLAGNEPLPENPDPQLEELKEEVESGNRGSRTATEAAKDYVAEASGLSVRKLEQILSARRINE